MKYAAGAEAKECDSIDATLQMCYELGIAEWIPQCSKTNLDILLLGAAHYGHVHMIEPLCLYGATEWREAARIARHEGHTLFEREIRAIINGVVA